VIITERESAIVGWILRPTPSFHMGRKNREGSSSAESAEEPRPDEGIGRGTSSSGLLLLIEISLASAEWWSGLDVVISSTQVLKRCFLLLQ